ncbi:MAG: hypothetical protein PVI30_09860 [Myxococcales bacterium]
MGGSTLRLRSNPGRGAPAAPRRLPGWPLWLPLLTLSCLSSVSLAVQAQSQGATVNVRLKDHDGKPAAGEVSLKTAKGETVASCEAVAGRCEMTGVPGGSYRVHVKPTEGEPPKPTSAMIPPEGEVTLHVSTGS